MKHLASATLVCSGWSVLPVNGNGYEIEEVSSLSNQRYNHG